MRFAPELHQDQGLTLEQIVDAVADGVVAGEEAAERAITVNLIVCAMRTGTRSAEIARLVERIRFRRRRRSSPSTSPGPRPDTRRRFIPRRSPWSARKLVNLTIHASEPPDLELIEDALA